MPEARVMLYVALALANAAAVIAWIRVGRRHRTGPAAAPSDLAIGFVTGFLDVLGVGSYAQITALFKLRRRPADELIPGTLNVGCTVPAFIESLLFITAVRVDPVLLACMVASAAGGAWLGAGIVSRMPRRGIQLLMGIALVAAAGFFALTNLGFLPSPGTAMSLAGWRFGVAVTANFALGALMCAGIGNYAPSMALLALLGMTPFAAYPIMIASDGVLIPVASMRFVRSGRFAHGPALGLTAGGIAGTLLAFPLVRAIAAHLALLRWLVSAVVLYAAVSMLRSAFAGSVQTGTAPS